VSAGDPLRRAILSNEGTVQMIVIGVDTHKRSHTLVALDAVTGVTRGQLTIPATDDGTCPAGWSAGFSPAVTESSASRRG
jgi:hypothetical protein